MRLPHATTIDQILLQSDDLATARVRRNKYGAAQQKSLNFNAVGSGHGVFRCIIRNLQSLFDVNLTAFSDTLRIFILYRCF